MIRLAASRREARYPCPRGSGHRRGASRRLGRGNGHGRRRPSGVRRPPARLRGDRRQGLLRRALGNASVIKVITNMLAFIHLVAAGEALMLARRAGLDLAQSYEVIKASSGTSFVHETESQVILNGSYDIGFTIDHACKDIGFARGSARSSASRSSSRPRRAGVRARPGSVRWLGVVTDGGEAPRGCGRRRPARARFPRTHCVGKAPARTPPHRSSLDETAPDLS